MSLRPATGKPGLTLSHTSIEVGEGADRSGEYTVALDAVPSANVTVSIATDDADAARPSANTLTFTAADWNQAQMVEVTGAHDDDTSDETVTFTHSGTGLSADATVTVTVIDDDECPFGQPAAAFWTACLTVGKSVSGWGYTGDGDLSSTTFTRDSTSYTINLLAHQSGDLNLGFTSDPDPPRSPGFYR